jgi:hypothetical protein
MYVYLLSVVHVLGYYKGVITPILAWIHGPIAMINDVVAME